MKSISNVKLNSLILCVVVICLFSANASSAEPIKVEITSLILPFDPQAGMKSKQILLVDFNKKTIVSEFKTGVTNIGFDIGSVRDKFQVTNIDFTTGRVGFTAIGETASGVMFMPNINYKFQIALTPNGKGAFAGCHDGYPAYEVVVAGKKVFGYSHQRLDLVKLFGECDITVPLSNF